MNRRGFFTALAAVVAAPKGEGAPLDLHALPEPATTYDITAPDYAAEAKAMIQQLQQLAAQISASGVRQLQSAGGVTPMRSTSESQCASSSGTVLNGKSGNGASGCGIASSSLSAAATRALASGPAALASSESTTLMAIAMAPTVSAVFPACTVSDATSSVISSSMVGVSSPMVDAPGVGTQRSPSGAALIGGVS